MTARRLTDADLQLESKHVSSCGARKAVPLLRPVRFLALASACFCVASLALAACGSATSPEPTTSASSALTGFTGYDWRVVAIRHEGKVTSIPARFNVDLRFSRSGRFLADDPINSHSGTFRMTPGGFTTSVLGVTLVGYAGHDPVILLSQRRDKRLRQQRPRGGKGDGKSVRSQCRLLHADVPASRSSREQPVASFQTSPAQHPGGCDRCSWRLTDRQIYNVWPGQGPLPACTGSIRAVGQYPPLGWSRQELLAAVTPEAQRFAASPPLPCAMAVYVRTGGNKYRAYGLLRGHVTDTGRTPRQAGRNVSAQAGRCI